MLMNYLDIIFNQLSSSNSVLRIRALQFICNNRSSLLNISFVINLLIDKIKIETHYKVIRWIAYTLAKIYNIQFCYLKENIIRALEEKIISINDLEVIEWLIASIEAINYSSCPNSYPRELESKQEFGTGVIKSWPYKNLDNNSIQLLIKALNHQDDYIRKWAALSLGNKENITEQVKNELFCAFEDTNYLVREWAIYAARNTLVENDFKLLIKKLDKEENVRVKEWIIKSIPYTMHSDTYNILTDELTHNFFLVDELYAEAVIDSLYTYTDIFKAENKMYNIIINDQRDIVILAAIRNILHFPGTQIDHYKIDILIDAFKKTTYTPIKQQILFHLYNSFTEDEKIVIGNLINFYNTSNKGNLIDIIISNNELLNQGLSIEKDTINYDLLMHVFDETRNSKTNKNTIYIKEAIFMRDQFNANQAGILGNNAGRGAIVIQNYNSSMIDENDFETLSEELLSLKNYIRQKMELDEDEKDILLGEVAQIGVAIKEKNSNKFLEKIQNSGSKIYDICKSIGCAVIARYISASLGL